MIAKTATIGQLGTYSDKEVNLHTSNTVLMTTY